MIISSLPTGDGVKMSKRRIDAIWMLLLVLLSPAWVVYGTGSDKALGDKWISVLDQYHLTTLMPMSTAIDVIHLHESYICNVVWRTRFNLWTLSIPISNRRGSAAGESLIITCGFRGFSYTTPSRLALKLFGLFR